MVRLETARGNPCAAPCKTLRSSSASILRHGRAVHPDSTVVTVEADGYRTASFAEVAERAERLAAALRRLGLERGRPGGHVLLEQPGPPGGLSRRTLHGRGAPHLEHPALPRAARLRHQPRRGPGHRRRRLAGPPARPESATSSSRSRPSSSSERATRGPSPRPSPTTSSSPPRSRASTGRTLDERSRRGHVLHERDHRQPQGGRVQPPVDLPALHGRRTPPTPSRLTESRPGPRHRADVPRQRLGRALRRVHGRSRPRHAPAVPSGRAARPHHRRPACHAGVRGPDDLERPAAGGRRRPEPTSPRCAR